MEIAIAGAGLVGRLLGRELVQRGVQVTLYERSLHGNPQGAFHVSAAMLAPLSELPESSNEIWELSRTSMRAWPEILDPLGVPYAMEGSIVVAHAQDEKLLEHFARSLIRRGVTAARWLDREELQNIEPELSNIFQRALFLPGEGWIENRCLHRALEALCGTIRYGHEVKPEDLDADVVCDCRGALADDPELRGVLGEVLRVYAPEVQLSYPIRIMHPRYQIYIAPRPRQHYVIGATQIENQARSRIAIRSMLELLSAGFVVHSGFAEAEIVEIGVGLRPAYPDNLPRIRWRGNVLSINGLYRHGYLIAPAIVSQAMMLLESKWNS